MTFLGDTEGTAGDTLEFQLKVKCTKCLKVADTTDPDDLYKDHKGILISGC